MRVGADTLTPTASRRPAARAGSPPTTSGARPSPHQGGCETGYDGATDGPAATRRRALVRNPTCRSPHIHPGRTDVTVHPGSTVEADFTVDVGLVVKLTLSAETEKADGLRVVEGTIAVTEFGKPEAGGHGRALAESPGESRCGGQDRRSRNPVQQFGRQALARRHAPRPLGRIGRRRHRPEREVQLHDRRRHRAGVLSGLADALVLGPGEWAGPLNETSVGAAIQAGELQAAPTYRQWASGASIQGWKLTTGNSMSVSTQSFQYFGWPYPPAKPTAGTCS